MWVDAGTEFKGSFSNLCLKKDIEFYKTFSEKKSAFVDRNIRSLKNLIYNYLEDKWTYSYINQLQSFVQTINSRVNRVTKLAPNKVTKKDVPYLISLIFNTSAKLVRRPKFSGTLCEYQKRILLLEKDTSKHLPTKFLKFTIYLQPIPLLIVSLTHPKSHSKEISMS